MRLEPGALLVRELLADEPGPPRYSPVPPVGPVAPVGSALRRRTASPCVPPRPRSRRRAPGRPPCSRAGTAGSRDGSPREDGLEARRSRGRSGPSRSSDTSHRARPRSPAPTRRRSSRWTPGRLPRPRPGSDRVTWPSSTVSLGSSCGPAGSSPSSSSAACASSSDDALEVRDRARASGRLDDREVDRRPAFDLVSGGRVLFEDRSGLLRLVGRGDGRDGADLESGVLDLADRLSPLARRRRSGTVTTPASAGRRRAEVRGEEPEQRPEQRDQHQRHERSAPSCSALGLAGAGAPGSPARAGDRAPASPRPRAAASRPPAARAWRARDRRASPRPTGSGSPGSSRAHAGSRRRGRGSRPGSASTAGTGCSSTCLDATATGESPRNGGRPVTISYSTHPSE